MSAPRLAFATNHAGLLREQWKSDQLNPWLRVVVLTTAALFTEQGAGHAIVASLLGNTEADRDARTPASYGLGAEIMVWGLPTAYGKRIEAGQPDTTAAFIVERLNLLFPVSGFIKTATYGPDRLDRIVLQVPSKGYDGYAMACWLDWGPVLGRSISPRRIRD